MKKSAVKLFDKLIVALLGLLGVFSSCEKDPSGNGDDPRVEYGMPFAAYEIKGVVTDGETALPIQNIRLIRPIFPEHLESGGDTIYTNAEGKYTFNFNDFPENGKTIKLEATDIDGNQNGGFFGQKEITVTITNADKVENGSGWYSGKFVKTKNIELDRTDIVAPMYGVFPASFKSSTSKK